MCGLKPHTPNPTPTAAGRLTPSRAIAPAAANVRLPRHALAHFGALAARLAGPRSRLIYGGYLADEKGEPGQALIEAGLTPLCFRAEGEWGACLAGPSAETES